MAKLVQNTERPNHNRSDADTDAECILRHKKSVSTSFADVLRPSGATAECDWPSTVGRYRSHSPDRASAQMTRAAGGIREVPLSNSNRCRG